MKKLILRSPTFIFVLHFQHLRFWMSFYILFQLFRDRKTTKIEIKLPSKSLWQKHWTSHPVFGDYVRLVSFGKFSTFEEKIILNKAASFLPLKLNAQCKSSERMEEKTVRWDTLKNNTFFSVSLFVSDYFEGKTYQLSGFMYTWTGKVLNLAFCYVFFNGFKFGYGLKVRKKVMHEK